jgi:hypothetical protein
MNLQKLQFAVAARLLMLLETHTDQELADAIGVSKRSIQNWCRDCTGMTIKRIEVLDTYFSKCGME